MTQINPWLSFNGDCRQAMLFYQQCLGGDLTLQTIADTAIAQHYPASVQGLVMYSMLVKGDWVLMGSDITGMDRCSDGNNITLALHSDSEKEIRDLYKNLSDGGVVMQALSEKPWGALFGAITDRFGKRWMFNCDRTV